MATQANVLICEDEKIIAKDIFLTLQKKGHHVTSILHKGEETLASIKANRPDLILMDIGLSGRWDGIKTAKIIKRNFDIPTIFVTSHIDETILDKAKAAKPYAFICKPVRDVELYSAIEFGIQRAKIERILKKRAAKKAVQTADSIADFLKENGKLKDAFKQIDNITLENEINNFLYNELKTNLSSMISHIEELSVDETLNQLQKHKIFAALFKYQKIINHLESLMAKDLN